MFLVPAFFLQGGAPAPEFDVSSGGPGLSAAGYPGAPQLPAGGTPVETPTTSVPPTTVGRAPTTVRPTSTTSTTVAARAAQEPAPTTTVARSADTPSTTSPPTTLVRATTTTTAGVVVSLPAVIRPVQQPAARTDRGVASWFGAPAATCAHRTLPFGTVVRVTRVATGATTECTVDDRGPSDTSRVIDLSTDTFEQLADASVGLIDVVIEW